MVSLPRATVLAAIVMLLAGGAALLASAPSAEAQTYQCGDIQLVFRNPDLQPRGDGFIHASGQFFAQFQALGDRAGEIEVFAFSFFADTIEYDESACDYPVWWTGPYLFNYRAARDSEHGFFIPIDTKIVPDGTYAAAVHAYDGNDNELARFWARAVVDNCDGGPGTRCTDDQEQTVRNDKTAPWPIVLPGDGQALEGRHLTVEFGEEVSRFTVHLNSLNITGEMQEWEGREWDRDLIPDYGPYGLGGLILPPCSQQPPQECGSYGPAYEWAGGRPLSDDDVVRVEAWDLAGNRAVKDIHIGSSVAGGAITQDIPILSWTVDETGLVVAPGQTAVFLFTLENTGRGEAHPFAGATAPDGWEVEWQPHHVPVPPGGRERQELLLTPPADAPHGRHEVNASLEYRQGTQDRILAQRLTVQIGDVAEDAGVRRGGEEDEGDGEDRRSPLPAAAVVVAVAAAALLARRGRVP